MIIGAICVVLGILFLLQTLGVIYGDIWGYIWPLVLIIVGVSMMAKQRCERCDDWRTWTCRHCPSCKKDESK